MITVHVPAKRVEAALAKPADEGTLKYQPGILAGSRKRRRTTPASSGSEAANGRGSLAQLPRGANRLPAGPAVFICWSAHHRPRCSGAVGATRKTIVERRTYLGTIPLDESVAMGTWAHLLQASRRRSGKSAIFCDGRGSSVTSFEQPRLLRAAKWRCSCAVSLGRKGAGTLLRTTSRSQLTAMRAIYAECAAIRESSFPSA
jgi:hypothetical protein